MGPDARDGDPPHPPRPHHHHHRPSNGDVPSSSSVGSASSSSAARPPRLVGNGRRRHHPHEDSLLLRSSLSSSEELGEEEEEEEDEDDDDEETGLRVPLLTHTSPAALNNPSNQNMATSEGGGSLRPPGGRLHRHHSQHNSSPSPVHGPHARKNGGGGGGRHNRRKHRHSEDDGEDIITANGDSPVRLVPTSPGVGRFEEEFYGGSTASLSGAKSSRHYPVEPLKFAAATAYMGMCMICTAVALALVHEKRPETPPLPDQILDRVVYQKWGLFACEYLIQLQTVAAASVVLFHRHRFILLRRVMLMVGALYLYRACTLWVTAVPIADENYVCAPKFNGTITAEEVAYRAFRILTGFGLSVNGHHVYCGDYIFSGHTMTIIMGHLIVRDYTPKRLFLLHWLTWLVACTSIVLLLVSRGHYTVDVVLAYYVTTRVWATYHTVTGHVALRQRTALNHFSRFWWFEPVRWMERNVKPGALPHEYNCPLPAPVARCLRKRLPRLCRGGASSTRKDAGKKGPLSRLPAASAAAAEALVGNGGGGGKRKKPDSAIS